MRFGLLAFFALLWMGSAVITAAVTETPAASSGGSTEAFTEFGNNVFASDELEVNEPQSGGFLGAASTAKSYASQAVGWVGFMFRSAALSSPIWEGWTASIRWVILALQLPLLLIVLLEGTKALGAIIPFT